MTHPPFRACGNGVKIYPLAKIIGHGHIEIGSNVIIDDFVLLMASAETKLGSFVHIAAFSSILGGGRLSMGDFSGISAGVRLFTGNDDYSGTALANPAVPEEYRSVSRSFIDIGRFCIVGANSVVLPGVKMGEGAIVGANSLLKHDADPWTMYAGNPARPIKLRRREGILARALELERRIRNV